MLKAVIVEDEPMSREILAGYIAKYCPDVTVVGTGDSVATGIEAIRKHKPDILFLDVEMPKGNGFDLLEQVGEIDFETVFVTAFGNYAIQALNYSAAYYILKPVSIDELILAVDKIKTQKQKNQLSLHTKVLLENIRGGNSQDCKIVLPLQDGFEVVKVRDIVHCKANDNFTDFHFVSKSKMMICRTLKFYEELLGESGFLRVHKSHLVNLDHVVKYTRGKGGQLTMADGSVIDVSPNKKDELMEKFERGK
ncbi:MAG: response regulator transcription factor [Bacteroidetes bacterium]|nr:response regulator transcription factor [Bacteroidota bacterium]